ncbi:MAG: tetratricopeptide repeat protein [Verrucomicrobiota bacterium]
MKSWLILFLILGTSFARAQIFESTDEFQNAIKEIVWEIPNSFERGRFTDDKFQRIDKNLEVSKTSSGASYPAPALIELRAGDYRYHFVLGQNGKSMAYSYTKVENVFVVDTPTSITYPTGSETVTINGNDKTPWTSLELSDQEIIITKKDGKTVVQDAHVYSPYCAIGLAEDTEYGVLFFSQIEPKVWWIDTNSLGMCVRTDVSGPFRPSTRSGLGDGNLYKSEQFNRFLVRGGQDDAATIQEHIAEARVRDYKGADSKDLVKLYENLAAHNAMESHPERSVRWLIKKFRALEEHHPDEKEDLMSTFVLLADAYAGSGDFDRAKNVLTKASANLADIEGNFRWNYLYQETVGEVQFGLKNYAGAAKAFQDLVNLTGEKGYKRNQYECLIFQAASTMAAGQKTKTQEILTQIEKLVQSDKDTFYDTHKLGFFYSALGNWQKAIQYSPESGQNNTITYMEMSRLRALIGKGDLEKATTLAKQLEKRLNEFTQIKDSIEEVEVALIEATANRSPESLKKLSTTWQEHRSQLAKKPLDNYAPTLSFIAALKQLGI